MKNIILFIAALISFSSCAVETINDQIVPNWKDSVLNKLKDSEGFRSTPYEGLDGKLYIGYGFSYPRLWNKNTITEQEAHVVLENKLDGYYQIAKADGCVVDNQAYAIADFIFNVGSTKYKDSTLRKLILSGKPIDNELMKWVHVNGQEHAGLKKRRLWELKMYNYDKSN
jgi:GH24 family phage-related lysozyme (muramidase)